MAHLLRNKIKISKQIVLRIALFCFVGFHISAILLNSITGTRSVYMRFYDLKETNEVFKAIQKVNFSPVFDYYGRVSGTDCGFGFFAPNVRSNSVLVVQGCKNKLTPMFNTHEGEQRFNGFLGDLINDYMPKENQDLNVKIDSLNKKYNALALKNIALNVMRQNKVNCDYFQVTYSVLDFPSMEEARATGMAAVSLIPARILLLNRKSVEEQESQLKLN